MIVRAYAKEHKSAWDTLIKRSKNGTFLLLRDYMDYHAARFTDASLLFFDRENSKEAIGVLPANVNQAEKQIVSHEGLTYGGLIVLPKCHYADVQQMLQAAIAYYRTMGIETITYKAIPHIYHSQPAEEDLYCLHQNGGKLFTRSISSSIRLKHPVRFSELRKRKVKTAKNKGISICPNDNKFPDFWCILEDILRLRHNTHPVHSLKEIQMLHERFPKEIQLVTALNAENKIIAGVVLYLTPKVIHAQYIAASEEGRSNGALDLLFFEIISQYKDDAEYFDFGTSTEEKGKVLNEGLIFQKEGFGGRGICYDAYQIDIRGNT